MAILFKSVVYTTTGTMQSINLDPAIVPFNATIVCTLSGAATYSMQYSITPFTVADGSANWIASGDIPVGTTTSAVSGLITPVSRVQLVIASISGSITLEVVQGLSTN